MKAKKPRRKLTDDERITRHVARHNAKQIAAVPLFADQVQQLEKIGVIYLKTETGFRNELQRTIDRLEKHKREQLKDAERYEAWVKQKDAAVHAREDANHRRIALRAPSLLQPHFLANHWFQVIRKHWGDLQARIVYHNDEILGRKEWEFWGSKP
jgi:hypothetical protein